MFEKHVIVGATICSLAALLTTSVNVAAQPAECLAAPNAPSRPGTHWHYRIDQTTKQQCWYLKDLRGSSRSGSASESATTTSPPPRGSELALSPPPPERESSITAWISSFSSKVAALTGAGRVGSAAETDEPSTNGPSLTRKRSGSERTELRKPQQSKSEQQIKSEQSK